VVILFAVAGTPTVFTAAVAVTRPLLPSCPDVPNPQHLTSPRVVTTHEWDAPEEMPAGVVPVIVPVTATGLVRVVGVPSPTCPVVLTPQQWTFVAYAGVIAQENDVPVDTAVATGAAARVPPVTATGIADKVVDPLPSWPEVFVPQQYTAPVTVTAHAWSLPALTWDTCKDASAPPTATGNRDVDREPLPSCPPVPRPQQ
jgi:hypothetical protein